MSAEHPDAAAPVEPRTLELDDPRAMRALAHPIRMKLLGHLRVDGPATATTLSDALDEPVPLLSYHLRQLARHGFIEEAPELARDGRERWWRSSHERTKWSTADFLDSPERMAAEGALMRSVLERYVAGIQRWREEASAWDPEWVRAATSGDLVLRLSPAQLSALKTELWALLERWSEEEPEEGAERVHVILHAFPFRSPP